MTFEDDSFPRSDAGGATAGHESTEAILKAALSDRYVIERELGRGGMAVVYLARDLRHDRAVAVKVLEPEHVPRSGVERFLHEIRIAARLTHPHVLSVHDSGEIRRDTARREQSTGTALLYYVMPFIDGETLRARLARDGALPLGEASRLMRELADALAYAHAQGVVHRDLKPENVLLSGGHGVVADFGIAKAMAAATQDSAARPSGLTSAGVALGTPAYMAPEQAVGDASTDQRADLYSLGVVAYEMFAGVHPFGQRSPQALVAAHLSETPPPLVSHRTDVPPAIEQLVMQLLAKDPAARPASAMTVVRALDDSEPADSTPARASSHPAGRRIRAPLIAATVLTALLAGYGIWRAMSTTEPATIASPTGVRNSEPIRTVAVLPFENTGGAAQDDYFSDGLTDELAHAIGQMPAMQLAGRTSSYAFKGKAAPAQEIGRVLEVAAFINGTVRRGGDRLRVTTQLVGTTDGKVIWDSVFESRSGDVFQVQDELTRAIVSALGPTLGTADGQATATQRASGVNRGTTDAEAYDYYLKGRYHFQERGTANVSRAIEYFKLAIGRDPRFARAHAALSQAYGVLVTYVPDGRDSSERRADASARNALALDSTLADAHVARALSLDLRLEFAEAEAHYRRAIAIEPSNVLAHHALGVLLLNIGRTDEAIAIGRRATDLDPLAKSAGSAAAAELAYARRFDEAESTMRRVLALDPAFPLSIWGMALIQAVSGQGDSAVATLRRGEALQGASRQLGLLLFAYAEQGRWADAERVRAELRRPGGDESGGPQRVLAEAVFGDPAPAVHLLSTRRGQIKWQDTFLAFGCNPLIDPLWSDERFRRAMRELGVTPCALARPWPFQPPSGSR